MVFNQVLLTLMERWHFPVARLIMPSSDTCTITKQSRCYVSKKIVHSALCRKIAQLKTGSSLFDKFLVALVVKNWISLAPTSQKLKCHHQSHWTNFQVFLANMVAGHCTIFEHLYQRSLPTQELLLEGRSLQLYTQLMQLLKESLKKNSGLFRIQTLDLLDTGAALYQLS